jgi:deoxyribodipyrimidine photo-lyase
VEDYPTGRDLPAREGVSRLSPYLHLGQLSPHQVWHEVHARAASDGRLAPNAATLAWLRQLVWREFAQHLLWHFPATAQAPLRPEFNDFPWCEDAPGFQRWCRGETGFPIVDAGMRQLWQTGWMHNRVRMIVASFLTKDLGLHWLEGARWFWDTLMDANLANNTLGWQWVAGCGADAAPYFRIFNPLTQSLKFDPEGVYLRRWLPELGALSGNDLHAPWQAAPLRLQAANFKLERDYPAPMLDHAQARVAALARLKASK